MQINLLLKSLIIKLLTEHSTACESRTHLNYAYYYMKMSWLEQLSHVQPPHPFTVMASYGLTENRVYIITTSARSTFL